MSFNKNIFAKRIKEDRPCLKNIEQQPPPPLKDFIKISRIYIANQQKITALNASSILLKNILLNVGKTDAYFV